MGGTSGVDGVAAANTLLSWKTCTPGYCLKYVWNAYAAHGATSSQSYPTALAGWYGSPGKHEGDRNPPAGTAVWLGARPDSDAGDVVISLGNGQVAATDWPGWGTIGVATLDQRIRQTGRPYLGWTETILGYPIRYSGGTVPPVTEDPEGEPMFIANVQGDTFVVLDQGQAKPVAVVLGADSGAVASGIPALTFTWQTSVDQFWRAVGRP
jgi:hypothetical protein